MSLKQAGKEIFLNLQSKLSERLESFEKSERFLIDEWTRADTGGGHGGGGTTMVLQQGEIFEQAGVNFSEVHGTLPAEMTARLELGNYEAPFYAAGTSIVIHPRSPMIPTTHANFRYLEVGDEKWFGGGMDLTPYYLFEKDAAHFHNVCKQICDKHDSEYYPKFKKWCDEYFYLPHRQEARGVGGLFFDYLGKSRQPQAEHYLAFIQDIAPAFIDCYIPIVEARIGESYTEEQKKWQLLRRGRYVEFNLIYDRGTLFGLKTGGRTESILMSLPPEVNWRYDYHPEPGSSEAKLLQVIKNPQEWANLLSPG